MRRLHDHRLRLCRGGKGSQTKQQKDANAAADTGNPFLIFVVHFHKAVQPYCKPASQSSNLIAFQVS
jgi:hypothetical protein